MKVGLAHSMHIQRGSPLSPRFPAGRRERTRAVRHPLAVESSRSRLPVPQPARGSAPIRAGPEPPRGREGSGGRARMVSLSPPPAAPGGGTGSPSRGPSTGRAARARSDATL